jgi:hypothetical protein
MLFMNELLLRCLYWLQKNQVRLLLYTHHTQKIHANLDSIEEDVDKRKARVRTSYWKALSMK